MPSSVRNQPKNFSFEYLIYDKYTGLFWYYSMTCFFFSNCVNLVEIMNKIIFRGGRFLEETKLLDARVNLINRKYSKDPKDSDKDVEMDPIYTARKGMLHDKQKSLQEESYFHKEESEQIKELKKKMMKGEGKKEKEDKDDEKKG